MSIDYRSSGLAFPKGITKLEESQAKKAALEKRDREERAKCNTRSGGRCEVVLNGQRCTRRSSENHHLESGIGRRNKGASILAAWRVDLCAECHRKVHNGMLDIRGPVSQLRCEARR